MSDESDIEDDAKRESIIISSDSSNKLALPPSQDLDAASVVSDQDDNIELSIHQAAREGAIEKIKEETKKSGIDFLKYVDQLNPENQAPIHLAARYNRTEVIKYLVEEGAWIDIPGEDKNTPLHIAVKYDCTEAAKTLIRLGANCTSKNFYGQTALHFACRRGNSEVCTMLVSYANIDVNGVDNSTATPLHMAVVGGNKNVVNILLRHNASIYVVDDEGQYPLHIAASEGQAELIPILYNAMRQSNLNTTAPSINDPINIRTKELKTPLHLAAQSGRETAVEALLSLGADVNSRSGNRSSPLHLAAVSGHIWVLRYIITRKGRINARDDEQMTPLHRACLFGRVDAIKYLHSSGAQIDALDRDNYTPLLCAVWKGHCAAVEYLLNSGANMSLTDARMRNVLHVAIHDKQIHALKLLLNKGAYILLNRPDKDYRTPIHYAAVSGNVKIIETLLAYKPRVSLRDNEEKLPIHLAALSGKTKVVSLLGDVSPGTLNKTDDRGRTPIHIATMNGYLQVCEKLIAMGAEISVKDDVQWTPLDYAASKGFAKVMSLLIENNANVESTNKNSETALHHAASHGHVECVTMLLNNGACITATTNNGKSCLNLAVENNRKDVCLALIKHKRWKDVMRKADDCGKRPMEKLIEFAPEVGEAVLDNCIEVSNQPKEHKDYWVTYNFEFLDILPETKKEKIITYFGPSKMAKFNRETLLSHPVSIQLVNYKWEVIGRKIYFLMLFIYMLYVGLLTALLVSEVDQKQLMDCTKVTVSLAAICFLLAVIQLLKEVTQMVTIRLEYFFDLENYVEIILYISSILFTLPFLLDQHHCGNTVPANYKEIDQIKWQAGAVCIFLAWSNLLLHLKRFPFFGLVVVMFIEVLRTIVSVLAVFSIVIIAFGLSFHTLLKPVSEFALVEKSLVKVIAMVVGEFDYSSAFNAHYDKENEMPFKSLTIVMFLIFIVLCPIVMMNLMVGLAVGEIAEVRKSAKLRMLKAQVELIKDLTRRYPESYLRRFYKSKITIKPNQRTLRQRFMVWLSTFNYDTLTDPNTDDEEMLRGKANREMERQLERQRKRLKKLNQINEEQSELIRKILTHMNVEIKSNSTAPIRIPEMSDQNWSVSRE